MPQIFNRIDSKAKAYSKGKTKKLHYDLLRDRLQDTKTAKKNQRQSS